MSTLSLAELTAQIQELESQRAQLQADAEKHRNEAMASVVHELIEQIASYGITAKELGLSAGKVSKTKPGRKALGARIAHSGKVHTGPNGQSWTEGTRGRKPHWVTEASSKTVNASSSSSN